jgi:hypothetical protein
MTLKQFEKRFKIWQKLKAESDKKYHAYEIANSKQRKAWEAHLKDLREAGRKRSK